MIAIDRMDHIVLTTNDLAASVRFYVTALGLEPDDANGRFAYRLGRQKINVHRGKAEFLPAARNPGFGASFFCLATDGEIGAYRDRLAAHGIPLAGGTVFERAGAGGPMRAVYVRDPDNNLVELGAYGRDAGSGALALDRLALDVADLEASVRFYGDLLGLPCAGTGDARAVSFAGGKLDLLAGDSPRAPVKRKAFPGSGDFCLITAEDIAAVHGRLLAGNAPFALDGIVPRNGALGPIQSVYLRDPDGNLVEISSYA